MTLRDDAEHEMELFDSLHPRARRALRDAPLNFNLSTMPGTLLNWARFLPGRFETVIHQICNDDEIRRKWIK